MCLSSIIMSMSLYNPTNPFPLQSIHPSNIHPTHLLIRHTDNNTLPSDTAAAFLLLDRDFSYTQEYGEGYMGEKGNNFASISENFSVKKPKKIRSKNRSKQVWKGSSPLSASSSTFSQDQEDHTDLNDNEGQRDQVDEAQKNENNDSEEQVSVVVDTNSEKGRFRRFKKGEAEPGLGGFPSTSLEILRRRYVC